MKIPVSAIVVVFNEKQYLEKCLKKLTFCDEIIVIDLGSSQPVVDICKKYATRFFTHEKVEIVEQIRDWACGYAKYKWVLFVDPDEVLGDGVITSIQKVICLKDSKDISCVAFKFQFYFKKILKGTFWSGHRNVKFLNTDNVEISNNVHGGFKSKNNTRTILLDNEENIIHHYWSDSWKHLFEKHRRYIKHEGSARYKTGIRYSGFIGHIKETWGHFFIASLKGKASKTDTMVCF